MMLAVDVAEAREALRRVVLAMFGRRHAAGARMVVAARGRELDEAERRAEEERR